MRERRRGTADDPGEERSDVASHVATKACPSAPCHEGALVLGVMTSSGRIAYLQPPMKVDANFAARAKSMGHPERTFRFSSPCIQAACPQWTGERCGIGELLAAEVDRAGVAASAGLPACSIRSSCRWYFEQGRNACAVCPLVVADTGGTETYRAATASAFGRSDDEGAGS
jgi:hypothetical protein